MGISMDSSEDVADDTGVRLRIGKMQRWLEVLGIYLATLEEVGDENPMRTNLEKARKWADATGASAGAGANDDWFYVDGRRGWGMVGATLARDH